ncbi:unnamed protein product [Porites evermanni]|uniref:DNA-directed DNA polymerase n=1 Tax=Porites evermanni TaxID=104178 RepID=A0ABN8PJ65_9CNID|nr:unnamed protein product [Porites evermanni]
MERYVSFQLGNLRFLDSIQFFGPGSSLDTLASTLNDFPILEEMFPQVWDVTPEEMELLCKKGVYPYSYMDNSNKFNETSLRPEEDYYNELTKEDISQEKYEFAQTVWSTMGCETLGDYHDIYLYQDIFLLADVFEQFRDVCLKKYDVDPAHYHTVPGLPNSFNIYYDANNLSGWAMSQPLPIGDFEWKTEFEGFDVNEIADYAEIGYILEKSAIISFLTDETYKDSSYPQVQTADLAEALDRAEHQTEGSSEY